MNYAHYSRDTIKILTSKNYNFYFNKKTGFFMRWGKSKKDDPSFSPYGPELLDLEITKGKCLGKCKFCYKCNGSNSELENMSLETFKIILNKMDLNVLTQIAFGITDIYANPDFFSMMEYAKSKGIIPNYTAHGLDFDNYAIEKTIELCGVVCISVVNKEKTFESIRKLHKAGMKQINIHFVLAKETFDSAINLINEIANNDIKEKINALVFLDYKPKGQDPSSMNSLTNIKDFTKITNACKENEISYGFDSCAAPMFLKSIEDPKEAKQAELFAEPCESGIFSSYINVNAEFFPCSFTEGENDWKQGINVLNVNSFTEDVWMNERTKEWREKLLNSSKNCNCKYAATCRSCPTFDSINICKVS